MYRNGDWKITAASIKGAVHESRNTPNQDSFYQKAFATGRFIFALGDGHGSVKCFRSEAGSDMAVKIASDIVEKHLDSFWDQDKLNARLIKKTIPMEIVETWKKQVDDLLISKPVTDEEFASLSSNDRRIIEDNPYLVYGSTLIITFFFDGYIICWQLGDGNILFVSDKKVSSMPMGKDNDMIANETYSLCMKKATEKFNIKVFTDSDPMLRLIVVSSDGYSNSFRNEAGFLQVGTDLLTLVDDEGFDIVENELADWLTDTMTSGSGDDITAGIFFRELMIDDSAHTDEDTTNMTDGVAHESIQEENRETLIEKTTTQTTEVDSEWV